MENLITVEKLIEAAKSKGINFGKGDPYNRLRYYTKIGWLPNMKRKTDNEGNVRGHYPEWAVDRLVLIEQLKEKGETNDEISRKLHVKNRLQIVLSALAEKETRNQIVMYAILSLLVLIVLNEVGIIPIGKSKNLTTPIGQQLPNQIIDSGTSFMPQNRNSVFVRTPLIKYNSRVYATFTTDFTPAVRYWVSDIREYEGFTLNIDAPVFQNSEFNWWITN